MQARLQEEEEVAPRDGALKPSQPSGFELHLINFIFSEFISMLLEHRVNVISMFSEFI